jgi:dCTP diphosphatase
MPDSTTTVSALREAMRQFVAEREWEQFHSPKNLVMALAAEAAELLEHFLWVDNAESQRIVLDNEKRRAVADEMADVAGCLFSLANALNLDLSDAIRDKMARNKMKYPVELYRGKW